MDEYRGECLQSGLTNLAKFMGVSKRTVIRNYLDEMKALGFVLEGFRDSKCRPVLKWFPMRVYDYLAKKQRDKYEKEHAEKTAVPARWKR